MNRTGVAISTTGDLHRLKFLETAVRRWSEVLKPEDALFVTVDGDAEAVARAAKAVDYWTESVYQVGQPSTEDHRMEHLRLPRSLRNGRLGVAVNKNTGIELLMGCNTRHLFLCDDDAYPLSTDALRLHTEMSDRVPHSMVCWGRNRKPIVKRLDGPGERSYAQWSWPRGVCLYTQNWVVNAVGGMDERFGPGGHEHVEYSRRIHQRGLTPDDFISPTAHARTGMGAATYWHAEDMPLPGEGTSQVTRRKQSITTVRREPGDWDHINRVMAERDGDTSFVPFRAADNGRASATLFGNLMGLGAGGE